MQESPKTQFQDVQYLTASPHDEGQRIDNYLFKKFKQIPKSRIYKWLRSGQVRVNKKRAKPDFKLTVGDSIRLPPLYMPEARTKAPPKRSLIDTLCQRVIYEDERVLVLNKPSGVSVHGGSGVDTGVIEILRDHYPGLHYLELVHRLDKDTSGCLVLAKKRSTLRALHALFREGEVDKHYLALTMGHWKPNDYKVNVPLKRIQHPSGERLVRVAEDGQASLTYFKPLETFENATLVEAKLMTGRTHQIRVHAASKDHPVAGDEKYGDKTFNRKMRDAGLKRLFLHSHLIRLTLPGTDQTIEVTAPLDEALENVLGTLKK